MSQKFWADTPEAFPNGAIGWGSSSPSDCLGPFAKVENCPVEGEARRYTCYATNYADTFFSVPACTRIRGKHIKGFFIMRDGSPVFVKINPPSQGETHARHCS